MISKRKIGVSISDNEDLSLLGYSSVHLRDVMIEIVRYLLINGEQLVYGGDLRAEGYTEIFSEMSCLYNAYEAGNHFRNYFCKRSISAAKIQHNIVRFKVKFADNILGNFFKIILLSPSRALFQQGIIFWESPFANPFIHCANIQRASSLRLSQ